jgi:signal transduction histidine kinase
MKGYSSLILDGDMGKIDAEAKKGISRIYESTETLTGIVDDYLNITRIELGTMKYAFETIDLKTLINDVVAELKPSIDKTKVECEVIIDDSKIGYRTTADKDKLKQVFINLIDNAFKYTPKGKVTIHLSRDEKEHKLVFKVSDNGIGISEETMPKLFDKFTRANNANKTNIKGTGLGLFVAREIARAHNGEIHAYSKGEGKGAEFIVTLDPLNKI